MIYSYSMEIEQIVCLLRIPMDSINKIVIGEFTEYLSISLTVVMQLFVI